MKPSLEAVTRTGCGVLRWVRAVLSKVTLPQVSSWKLVLIVSIVSGSIRLAKRKLLRLADAGSSSLFDR